MRLAIATGVALTTGLLWVPAAQASTSPTTPSSRHLHDDFNGDGYPDLAIGAPGTALGSQQKAGAITVLYGSSSGMSTSRKQSLTWSQRTGTADPKQSYGSALQSADLDGDGYADLVSLVGGYITTGGGTRASGHWVTVNWGGPKGLSATPTLLTATSVSGYTLGDADGDHHPDLITWGAPVDHPEQQVSVEKGPFTRAGGGGEVSTLDIASTDFIHPTLVIAGDVNGDGIADLAVGTSSSEESDSRGVAVLLGSTTGFGRPTWLRDGVGRIGGEDLATGDLNRDGYGDIVVGHSFDGYDSDVELPTEGGAVIVVYGGPQGLSTTRKPVWINQDTPGVPGVGEYGDGMGTGLSIGDTDGDGYPDVATGLPNEDFDGITNAGSVLVLRGSAIGLTGTGAKVFSQNTTGVPGTAEKGDRFGLSTALVDANADHKAGLVVGDPDENASNGSVWVFSTGSGGITANGSFSFGAATAGLPNHQAEFGESLD
ncbi:FG-GAP-like repeat-containing protein [Streptomyces sp. NPDC005813]|uniref:FG-GAP-like repeat-containing protein n=1 Tax=Streptomyces sp. NPDC005813 TaxID=3155592 RepID=UPI0033C4F7A8